MRQKNDNKQLTSKKKSSNSKLFKEFQKTVKKLNEMLRSNEILLIFSPELLNLLQKGVDIMNAHLKTYWEHNRGTDSSLPIAPIQEEVDVIKKSLHTFLFVLNERPITPFIRDFIGNYALLIFNWNNMILRSGEIDQLVKSVDRILRMEFILVEAIDTFKRLNLRLRQLLEYSPPAFKLAEHYLSVLREKIQGLKYKKNSKIKKKNFKGKS